MTPFARGATLAIAASALGPAAALPACRVPERGTAHEAIRDGGAAERGDAESGAPRAEDADALARFAEASAPGLVRIADVDLARARGAPAPLVTLREDGCVRVLVLGEGRAHVVLETGAAPLAEASGELPLALAPSGVVCVSRGRALALRIVAEHDGGAPPAPRRAVAWASPEADGGPRRP